MFSFLQSGPEDQRNVSQLLEEAEESLEQARAEEEFWNNMTRARRKNGTLSHPTLGIRANEVILYAISRTGETAADMEIVELGVYENGDINYTHI